MKTLKIGRKKDHRELTERNLLTSLVLYEKITTTKAKSQLLAPRFDKLMSLARKSDNNAKRAVAGILLDKKATLKVFDILVPRYSKMNSGLTNKVALGNRKGDNSKMIRIILRKSEAEIKEKVEVKKEDASAKKSAKKMIKGSENESKKSK